MRHFWAERRGRIAPPAIAALCAAAVGLVACEQPAGVSPTTGAAVGVGVGAGIGRAARDDDEGGGDFGVRATSAAAVTTLIVTRLREIWRACEAETAPEYHIDCLSEGYVRAASLVPPDDIFGPSRQAILGAAARLDTVARSNQAATLPTVTTRGRARPLRAVDPQRQAAATAAAVRIIEETETLLLRSAGTSAQRTAFAQIAEAVGSSKALLRS